MMIILLVLAINLDFDTGDISGASIATVSLAISVASLTMVAQSQ
jgi:hypothetical protein